MQSFTKILLPFAFTNSFDKLFIDYLNNDVFLRKYYAFEPSSEGLSNKLQSYLNPRLDREKLVDALRRQYMISGLQEIPRKVQDNIDSLLSSNTFTVTTGHQLNIFSGPLYVFYKLISAVNLSEQLNKLHPSCHFVPVYWMATEDHDIPEISSFNMFGKTYKWDSTWKGNAGNMPLDGIEKIISDLKNSFGSSPFANELISAIEMSYLNSTSLAEATRKWVTKFLGEYGLIILDGNDSILKGSFKDILIDELRNQTSSSKITHTIKELEVKYDLQANPREINLFYLGDGFRERIVKEEDYFKVLNTDLSFSVTQIEKLVADHPERFSPNVVLRPLYQECILPNIAFIGGPSEVAYWLELKSLFDHFNVPMPALINRNSVLLIENNLADKLDRFSIKEGDVFLPVDEMIKKFIQKKDNDLSITALTEKVIHEEFNKLKNNVSRIDQSLTATVEAEYQKISSSLKSIEEKTMRSQKKKNETEVNQIRKLKEKLFPNGNLQEREDILFPFYLKYGMSFITLLKENLDPLNKQFIILREKTD